MKHLIVQCPRHWYRKEPMVVIVDDDVYEWASQKRWRFDDGGRVVELRRTVTKHGKSSITTGKQLSRLILGLDDRYPGRVTHKEFSDDYRRENLIVLDPYLKRLQHAHH